MASGDVSGRLHTLWSRAGNFESKKVPEVMLQRNKKNNHNPG